MHKSINIALHSDGGVYMKLHRQGVQCAYCGSVSEGSVLLLLIADGIRWHSSDVHKRRTGSTVALHMQSMPQAWSVQSINAHQDATRCQSF